MRNFLFLVIFLIIIIPNTYSKDFLPISNNNPQNKDSQKVSITKENVVSSSTVNGGNSFSNASIISIGSVNGTFNSSVGGNEFYKVNLNASTTIIVTAVVNTNTSVTIFNPFQQLIGSDASEDVQHVEIVVISTGYHYIQISRNNLTFNFNFTLSVTNPANGPIGGSLINSSVLITPGTFSNYFDINQANQFFKIYLHAGIDVFADIFGESNELIFYNSSGYIMDDNISSNQQMKLSIFNTDYYYLRIAHNTGRTGIVTITVTTTPTGSIYYVEGGNSFATANMIPIGNVQNRLSSIGSDNYFKIALNKSFVTIFSLSVASASPYSNDSVYFYIYSPNQSLIMELSSQTHIDLKPNTLKKALTLNTTGSYFIRIAFDYVSDYIIGSSIVFDQTDGGNNFTNAPLLISGDYSGYLTNNEQNDFYKFFLNKDYDLLILVTGECNSLSLYNSSEYLLQQKNTTNPIINMLIETDGYYYFELSHNIMNFGSYNISINAYNSSEPIYSPGGNSFALAKFIPTGTIINNANTNTSNDYYKIDLITAGIINFTLIPLTPAVYSNEIVSLYIYNQNETIRTDKSVETLNQQVPSSIQLGISITKEVILYILVSIPYNSSYKLVIETIQNPFIGNNNINSAPLINIGKNYTAYLTNEATTGYFLIFLDKNTDILINASGSFDYLTIYNSTDYPITQADKTNSFLISILETGFYYIEFSQIFSIFSKYTFTVNSQTSGSILYVNGGTSLNTAPLIPLGTIQNKFNSSQSHQDFKVSLFTFNYYVITLKVFNSPEFLKDQAYLMIYESNSVDYSLVKYSNPQAPTYQGVIHFIFQATYTGYFYLEIGEDYVSDYQLNITSVIQPTSPTNIQANFNSIDRTITVYWTDSYQTGLTYFIYMDNTEITYIDPSTLQNNFKLSSTNKLAYQLVGNVSSGIEQFVIHNPSAGSYYFAVVAVNSDGLGSQLNLGESASANGLVVSYNNIIKTTSHTSITSITNNSSLPAEFLALIISVLLIILMLLFAIYRNPSGRRYIDDMKRNLNNWSTRFRNNNPEDDDSSHTNSGTYQDNLYTELENNPEQFSPPVSINDLSKTTVNEAIIEQQSKLIDLYKAPSYDLALVTKSGNFPDYDTYKKALDVGAKNYAQWELVQKFRTPDYLTAKKIEEGQFDDYEQYLHAQILGASNQQQLQLIEKFGAPNFLTAKKISDGHFKSYQQFLEAEKLGADNIDQLIFTQSVNAPSFEYAKKVFEGNFQNVEQYTRAISLGAKNLEQLQLIEAMKAPNYAEACKVKIAGFIDYQDFTKALSEGFSDAKSWQLFQKRCEVLKNHIETGSDILRDTLKKELSIENNDELLAILDLLNVPSQGSTILFSNYDRTFDIRTVISEFTRKGTNKLYKEFHFSELPVSKSSIDLCKICFQPLVGELGTCPKCYNSAHSKCISEWLDDKKACPICKQKLEIQNLIITEITQPDICLICKKHFNANDIVIRCQRCLNTFHNTEFQEFVKIKGKCPKCNQNIQL